LTYVFAFDHQHAEPPMNLKHLLGGKGANLAEMTSVLSLPVPPGFTITTDACRAYMVAGWPEGLSEEVADQLSRLETTMGKRLGDPADPLLVSVRSGAKFSMPGMMDTVLNLGLNDESVRGLAAQTSDERFAYDSYRRFVSMYGRIVLDIPGSDFEGLFTKAKAAAGVAADADLPPDVLMELIDSYKDVVLARTGEPFPQAPADQLRGAIEAVFRSWNGPRAIVYREHERIPHDLGTAVNVQSMVFGNRDTNSATGVGFTRDPSTGEAAPQGDFLVNAQGEDVVAGTHQTLKLDDMRELFPDGYEQLLGIFDRLERHYRDMCDTEFTIEQGKLWMLQTRVGKRGAVAALRMAVEMCDDPRTHLSHAEAVMRVTPDHLDNVLHPQFGEDPAADVVATGLAASPGAAVGRVYFTADDAEAAAGRGEKVILVRNETSPEDVHGMAAAQGILTARGGLVSHAALVARGWGKPAVVGAEAVRISDRTFTAAGRTFSEGDVISIDGSTGRVVGRAVALSQAEPPAEFNTVLGWADEIRAASMAVRANADTGADATVARDFGAEGIGLCRTEHMFLGDRLPIVRRMILADTPEEETAALEELRQAQKADFLDILEAMDGLPVTVRLLDPPLHEFLPRVEELAVKEATGSLTSDEKAAYAAAQLWHEMNPMLGTRGVRLGVIKPGLYAMQVRALMEAAAERAEAGGRPVIEIMIPLTVSREELALARSWVEEAVGAVAAGIDVTIGTMIETPRAAIRADQIAEAADFFSFGTNDLTQMVFGFSRDDVEGRLMSTYLEKGLLKRNPFETIDPDGVGELVADAVRKGRSTKPGLKVGVCGEHGGDPESITLFHAAGLDYVSCSPFRVPIARLAAAQAVLGAGGVSSTA
jgi:pyruvate, orthophosphate dikinase